MQDIGALVRPFLKYIAFFLTAA